MRYEKPHSIEIRPISIASAVGNRTCSHSSLGKRETDSGAKLEEKLICAYIVADIFCFFNEIKPFSNVNIFKSLETLINDRKINPVEKSYTNYLLDQGVDKICKKVGEEASETIIAAKNNDKEELIGEISDLFYHIFVLMNNQGVSLEDIENKLKERHKITGNKKEFHTRGEY